MINRINRSKLFPSEMTVNVGVFVLMNLILTITGYFFYPSVAIVGFCCIIGVFFGSYYNLSNERMSAPLRFVERYAVLILIFLGLMYLIWFWLVLFSNPYRYAINQGDASVVTQLLFNLVDGFRPEYSFKTLNGPVLPGEDPRFPEAYGYISAFSQVQSWLPVILLTPLYAISPEPPMHVFATVICIIVIGLPGIYWAVRKAGGSSVFAFFATVAYFLLPHVSILLFFKAYMEPMGLAVLPWLFGALFSRNWRLVYVWALLTALISFGFSQFVIIFGLTTVLFFGAVMPGLIVMLIGMIVMVVDSAIITLVLSHYYDSQAEIPSLFKHYVLDRTVASFYGIVLGNGVYVLSLLQAVAFIPILALFQNGRWNKTILGIFFMLGLCFGASLFRSHGWEFQRNAFFIVPVFMMGIVGYLSLKKQVEEKYLQERNEINNPNNVLLVSALLASIFAGNPYDYPSPAASHLPWAKGVSIVADEETKKWDKALAKFNEVVPKTAAIAWRASSEVQGILTNRQHSWIIGSSPKGVKYYAFIGEASSNEEELEWGVIIKNLKNDSSFKIIFDGKPGKPLLVFENLNAKPIPRNDSWLGWSFLSPTRVITQILSLE
jgi:hypothetical protein